MNLKKLLPILLVGLGLRLWTMTWGLPDDHRPVVYYTDEWGGLQTLIPIKPSEFKFRPGLFHNPAFFYYQVGAAIKVGQLTGLIKAGDKEFYAAHRNEYQKLFIAGRLMACLYSMLTILLLYFLTKELFDPPTALLAAAGLAVLPVSVHTSHFFEVSGAFTFWVGCAMLALVKAVQQNSLKWFYRGAMLFGVSLATKYLSAPLLVPVLVCHWFLTKKVFSFSLVKAGALSLLFFILGNPYMVIDFPAFLSGLSEMAAASGAQQAARFNLSPIHTAYGMGWILFFVCVLGLCLHLLKKNKPAILVAGFVGSYWLLLGTSSVVTTRYSLPIAFLLLPFGAWWLTKKIQTAPAVGWILSLVVLVPSALYSLGMVSSMRGQPDTREQASNWIEANIPHGATVGLFRIPYWYSPPAIYTEYGTDYRFTGPEWRRLGFSFQTAEPSDPNVWKNMPTYAVVTQAESKLIFGTYDYAPLLTRLGYTEIMTFDKNPAIGPLNFPKRSYYSLEWSMPFPKVSIWKK